MEYAKSVRSAAVFSTISNDFMDSPTLNPLAPAQSKHSFSILASAPEKPPKSYACESILEACCFKFRDFGLEALSVRSRCRCYESAGTQARLTSSQKAKSI